MDYCTLWFEGWWAHCCAAHDQAYAEQVGQAAADAQLFTCVATSLGERLPDCVLSDPWIATVAVGLAMLVSGGVGALMWLGVRLGGRLFYRRAGNSPVGLE